MKEYLQESFNDLVNEYLEENCEIHYDYVDYGDTQVKCASGYSDKDYEAAKDYALEKIEEALEGLKKENGFIVSEKEFTEAVDAAILTINKI